MWYHHPQNLEFWAGTPSAARPRVVRAAGRRARAARPRVVCPGRGNVSLANRQRSVHPSRARTRPRPRRPRTRQRCVRPCSAGVGAPSGSRRAHPPRPRRARLRLAPATTQNATQVVALSTLAGPQGPSRICYVLRVRVFDDHWRPLSTTGDQWRGCSVRALIRFRGHYDTSGAPDSPPQYQGRVWMPSEKALEAYDRLRIWSMPPKGEHRWRRSSVRAHTCKSLRHARSTQFASAGPRSNLDTFCAGFRGR